jgi:hypothetical protein
MDSFHCLQLLLQYIRSYPPYLEAVSSIRNQRTCYAVVTWDPLNIDWHINRKPRKTSVTGSFPAEIWTEHLPNASYNGIITSTWT